MCNLQGFFWLLAVLLLVETSLFSVCFVWTLPPLPKFDTVDVNVDRSTTSLAESVTRRSNMYRTVIATLAVLTAGIVHQGTAEVPIPTRPPGFVYGDPSCKAPVHLEAFVDLICPDSKAAWQTYLKVADYYGPETMRFSALLFPLPYHRAAMMAAQGSFAADMMDANKTYRWFDVVFAKQAALYDTTIADQVESFISDTLADWAEEAGYSRADFVKRLARSDVTQSLARVEFKYGATRGVYGTPQTYINGALVEADPSWTLDDWKRVIDPILLRHKYIHHK